MLEHLDENAIRAAFAQPAHDGVFPDAFRAYLRTLARDRPCVLLAFPPKAAGTLVSNSQRAKTRPFESRTSVTTKRSGNGGPGISIFFLPTFRLPGRCRMTSVSATYNRADRP